MGGLSRATTKKFIDIDVETMSYAKLKTHINDVHPRINGNEFFPFCSHVSGIGYLPICCWSRKRKTLKPKSQPAEDGNVIQINDVIDEVLQEE